jgi:hypothetical protein
MFSFDAACPEVVEGGRGERGFDHVTRIGVCRRDGYGVKKVSGVGLAETVAAVAHRDAALEPTIRERHRWLSFNPGRADIRGDYTNVAYSGLSFSVATSVIARNGATKQSSWIATARFAHLAMTKDGSVATLQFKPL